MKKSFYLGIDIGGTKINGLLLNAKTFKWRFVLHIDTPKNRKNFLKKLGQEIEKVRQENDLIGIGVGIAGIIDIKSGIVIKAPNLSFLDKWKAKKYFSQFSKKVKIDNDSRCFLIAEKTMGSGKKYNNAIGITFGTGIGGGIIIGGKIYYGKNFGAGEFGNMIINTNRNFEELAGKKAFLKMGDRSRVVGVGVANLINIFDPEVVILGGGGIFTGGIKIKTVWKIAQKYIMSPLAKKTPIIKGKLGEYSQAIGAALLMKIK